MSLPESLRQLPVDHATGSSVRRRMMPATQPDAEGARTCLEEMIRPNRLIGRHNIARLLRIPASTGHNGDNEISNHPSVTREEYTSCSAPQPYGS